MFDSKTTVLSHISSFPLFQYNVIEIMVRITAHTDYSVSP